MFLKISPKKIIIRILSKILDLVTELNTTIILGKVPKAVLSEFEDVITLRSGLVFYRRGSHIGCGPIIISHGSPRK